MDVSPFQRVLVAGFIAGGSEDVDANLETVRLLRSQLRTKSPLRVIEADVLPLVESRASRTRRADGPATATAAPTGTARQPRRAGTREGRQAAADPQHTGRIKDEKDLEPLRAHLRERRLLEEARRGVPEPADRHRHRAVHAARALRVRAARAGVLRHVRPPPRGARAHLHGAEGVHPPAEVHLHRRPHRARRSTPRRSARRSSTARSRTRRPCRRTSS